MKKKQTNKHDKNETDRQADKQTDKQNENESDFRTNIHTDKQAGRHRV